MKIVAAAAAVLFAPLAFVVAAAAAVGGNAGGSVTGAVSAAAVACAYGSPDPERIAVTMEQLTADPVDVAHWDTYQDQTAPGDEGVAWDQSTVEQRHQLLVTAVTTIINATAPHALTTPLLIWWHGTVPVDDNDNSWQDDPVAGWDGTLDTYLQAFANSYVTDPDVVAVDTDTTCQPPTPSGEICAQPDNDTAELATIRALESGDHYTEHTHSLADGGDPRSGNPSGGYQYLATTWNNYGGYTEAFQAPPDIQDQRARQDIDSILNRFGTVDWIPVAWYVGAGGADKIRTGEWASSYIPNPAYNQISIGDYQTRWMDHYTTIALPAAGVAPTVCPAGATAVIAFADTQIGAPYAAIDPYRFGAPAWPGGTLTGSRKDSYTYPRGTVVYDCSGLVIAAWRTVGVDFVGQYGIYGSQSFNDTRIPDAYPDNLQPGDIAVYRPGSTGVGHVVLIHHIDPDGTARTIEATPSGGVHIGTLDFTRVTALKHPTVPV